MRDAKPLYKPGMAVAVDGGERVCKIDEVRHRASGVTYVVVDETGRHIGDYPEHAVKLAWMPPNASHVDDESAERMALSLIDGGGSSSLTGDACVYVSRTEHEDLFRVQVYRLEKWTLMAKPKGGS
jgi:hypothetical protein